MFGIKHIKFDAMTYVIHYLNGRIKREGRGLSFFYFAPNSSIVAIPMGSNDLPFIFQETTSDYQKITIQGQLSYVINKPQILADILDFTVDEKGKYQKNDIEKLNQRLINAAQTATSVYLHDISLRQALRSAKAVENRIMENLQTAEAIAMLGVEVLGASVLAVKANPEMTRALEAETREKLQQEADQAIYERRNFAVEAERKIKESELNTEIAVEEKHKQIAQKKMESDVLKAENHRRLREMNLQADIAVENQRQELIDLQTENDKKLAETKGYAITTTLEPYKNVDWKTLTALSNNGDPKFNIALAFRELAENADKIGNLNISPDLLDSILSTSKKRDQ